MLSQSASKEPFGTLLGYAPGGVAIYSSDYENLDPEQFPNDASFRSYSGHEYMGYKWQCVEFARRFLFLNYGIVFTDVGMAHEIFSLRFLRQVINDNKIRIAEQNVIHTRLPIGQQWTRELAMTVSDEGYYLHDTFDDTKILGWMIQTDDTLHSLPQPNADKHLLDIHSVHIKNHGQFDGKWLDENDPLESAYVSATGHAISHDDQYRYFTISESAEQELIRATNELHLMYLHATDKVLKDDSLLCNFNIPEILWPRLRLSWQQRRYQMITGRLDFCMDERGFKVYEYNADSASCHTEAGKILENWVIQAELNVGSIATPKRLSTLCKIMTARKIITHYLCKKL